MRHIADTNNGTYNSHILCKPHFNLITGGEYFCKALYTELSTDRLNIGGEYFPLLDILIISETFLEFFIHKVFNNLSF